MRPYRIDFKMMPLANARQPRVRFKTHDRDAKRLRSGGGSRESLLSSIGASMDMSICLRRPN